MQQLQAVGQGSKPWASGIEAELYRSLGSYQLQAALEPWYQLQAASLGSKTSFELFG